MKSTFEILMYKLQNMIVKIVNYCLHCTNHCFTSYLISFTIFFSFWNIIHKHICCLGEKQKHAFKHFSIKLKRIRILVCPSACLFSNSFKYFVSASKLVFVVQVYESMLPVEKNV